MSNKIRIGVLMGGSSAEREISYRSANNIVSALDTDKYTVSCYDIPINDSSWIERLLSDRPDIVLIALHGGKGENGCVQGVLSCLGIPFVGSGVTASALCMDKALCKTVMESAHIPVIEGFCVRRGSTVPNPTIDESAARTGYPLIVKPNNGGSSLGIAIVNNADELNGAINSIFEKFDDDALVEKYISGREVTCAVIEGESEPEVISVLDINKSGGIFDYKAKYEDKEWSGGISNLPPYMQATIKGIAKKAFALLGCRGYACVDMILVEEQVYVIEVNTLPGMTAQSLIPNAVKALGMELGLGSFIDRLIEKELGLGLGDNNE